MTNFFESPFKGIPLTEQVRPLPAAA